MTAKGIGKIVFAAFLGTVIEILGLIFLGAYHVVILCVHLFEVPLMIWFVLGKANRKMLRMILSGYFFIMLINGILEILWNQFGETGNYVFYLLFSCGSVFIGVRIWKNYTQMQKGVFSVELIHKGKRMVTRGFYDSGNRLIDPYTGKGVNIISERLLKRLGFDNQKAVFVPYQALGNEEGIIEVYYADELIIEGEKGRQFIHRSPLGVTKDNLFEDEKYEMILNEEVF